MDELPASFRTSEALRAGRTARDLRRLVDEQVLHQPAEGRYVLTRPPAPERVEHRALVDDELAVLEEGWHAAYRSAAVLFDLPLLGRLPARPQLLRDPRGTRARAEDRFRRVSRLPADQCAVVAGQRATSLPRTVVDLSRTESWRSGLVVADAALGTGVDRGALLAVLATMNRWPGVRRAREVLAFADGLAESPLESLSRHALVSGGVRPPLLQVEVRVAGEYVLRADKLWLPEGVVGEDDGLAKFGDDAHGREESFRATKRTEDRLAEAGLVVVRWGWDEAYRRPGALVQRVQAAMRRARPELLDPALRFRRTTVEDRLARERWFRRAA